MKNIFILPTENPSRLYRVLEGYLKFETKETNYRYTQNQNIYITSDEEIKEGDWYLNTSSNTIHKSNGTEIFDYRKEYQVNFKIILTTDQDLIKDGVQAIDDEFLEWFVKNPSCEIVKVGIGFSNENDVTDISTDYEIIIPSSEIWKDIPEFEGYYQVSNLGNVRSLNYGKIRELKPRLVGYNDNQYLAVNLSKESEVKSVKVHKLVALCFLNHTSKGYDGLVIDHIDSNKLNNRLDNLKLVTPRFNASKDKQGSSSKFTGVTWHKKSKKWQCQIYDNGKLNHLGLFNTEIEASETYNNYLENMTKEEPKQDRTCTHNCSVVCGECQIFEPKQETLEEEADKQYPLQISLSLNHAFKCGAKWQQQRSYSEDRVDLLHKAIITHLDDNEAERIVNYLFKQFKKKL